ncbi:DUF3784 domain-containing protein [Ornithinibacillus sp. FSL M8-0202]|uniref:DUF3784 domain-containing protein n=1 Tax=unclassified Ornithinibacillus TaxID=2620869 RepID=UPI0030CFDAD3
MTTGMLIFIVVMGWILIIHGGMTYLIVKKKEYSLISGFYNRPKEEQEYLIENGYIEKLGKIFVYSFYILLLAILLTVFRVPYGPLIGFSLFTVFLLGGLIYLQKYELPHKRKKSLWIIVVISTITVGIIAVGVFIGSTNNDIIIENEKFIISGMYGDEWAIDDIAKVELLDELPAVLKRTNGYSSENVRKGQFKLEDPYGQGKLFVAGKEGPFLYIAFDDSYVILNRESKQETVDIYEKLIQEQ